MRKVYLTLSVIGFVLPYYFLVSFVLTNGLDAGLFFRQLFANPAAAMFTTDLVISSFVFWAFAYPEAQKHQMRYLWVYILANLLVGLSFALPLFLYFREARVEAQSA